MQKLGHSQARKLIAAMPQQEDVLALCAVAALRTLLATPQAERSAPAAHNAALMAMEAARALRRALKRRGAEGESAAEVRAA